MWRGTPAFATVVFAISVAGAAGAPPGQNRPPSTSLELKSVTVAPKIDGVLDDGEWSEAALPTGDWLSYNPLYGERLPHQTTVWAAYDRHYLYFAFRCTDPDPKKIRTTIARRDSMWGDDWVGLSLDAMGDGQTSYDFFVNPSGIQGDILTSSAKGESSSVDWVWESAARLTPDGYAVELRVPLQSIRFKSGAVVPMRILFWRRISRLGMSLAWPDLPPGKSVFERHASLVVRDLAWPGVREVIPSVTQSVNQARTTPSGWSAADSASSVGVSAKFGLTSAVTFDGTVNPDFSQVESDAFQVQVNQRYPVFYSEKRPFFMEGMGVFELAGAGGDGNMAAAVHTRRIADPSFGVKLSGTLGKVTFGTISASDDAPGRTDPRFDGKHKLFDIARATYSLGPSSYVGAIFTDTEFGGGYNRVVGGDGSFKFGPQRLSVTLLQSASAEPDSASRRSGAMAQASYYYDTRRLVVGAQVEHYDEGFQMDTAFFNRTGITGGWVYGGLNFYPDKARTPWMKKINPFLFEQYVHDRGQGGNDNLQVYGVRFNFTRQGNLRGDIIHQQEAWAHRQFDKLIYRLQGGVQLTNWLNLSGQLTGGDGLYYDLLDPFLGRTANQGLTVSLQPSPRFGQTVSFTRATFDRPEAGGRVYDVKIVNTKTTYQFSPRLAVRAVVQYDNSRARVLTDFLSSYEVRPGTVIYAGYGALFEQRDYRDSTWIAGEGGYLTTSRGLFIKASYLHRF